MSEIVSLEKAKQIMADNFIGPDELASLDNLRFALPSTIPPIEYSEEELEEKSANYMLILGVSRFASGENVSIRNLVKIFGKDPEKIEPCFYNQDWYEKEEFIDMPMKEGWFFIRKNVYDDSRAVNPEELGKTYTFPSAISCVYSFFTVCLYNRTFLWYHDFVWCSDTDHNGDRIYVGKYHDIDGINKNGFSIHRHLALRSCYGCID